MRTQNAKAGVCSGTVRQPDAGCCRPQRKSREMEGSQEVERVLADNGTASQRREATVEKQN